LIARYLLHVNKLSCITVPSNPVPMPAQIQSMGNYLARQRIDAFPP